jgi:hypothetical protein
MYNKLFLLIGVLFIFSQLDTLAVTISPKRKWIAIDVFKNDKQHGLVLYDVDRKTYLKY